MYKNWYFATFAISVEVIGDKKAFFATFTCAVWKILNTAMTHKVVEVKRIFDDMLKLIYFVNIYCLCGTEAPPL